MWSSSRRAIRGVLVGSLLAGSTVAFAAETFMQPMLETGVTHHTNRGLDLEEEEDEALTGLEVDASAIFGIITPASRTQVRPSIVYQAFEQDSDKNNGDYGLDFRSQYNSPRHDFELIAKGQRRETFSTEYLEPGFDDFDPNDPTINDPGRLEVDNTITRVQLRPKYDYRLTERTRIGLTGIGQAVRFGDQLPGARVDYDYASAGVSWEFLATQRTALYINPYVSMYDTKDETYQSESAGAAFGIDHAWSQAYNMTLGFQVERDDVERVPLSTGPPPPPGQSTIMDESTNWSALATLSRKGELSNLRFAIGRVISPSTRGIKVSADYFNFEWTRDITERFELVTSARYVREHRLGTLDVEDDRTHAGAELQARWRMTPRWYLTAGVEALYRAFESDSRSATDESVFLGFGYIGLGPQTGSTE